MKFHFHGTYLVMFICTDIKILFIHEFESEFALLAIRLKLHKTLKFYCQLYVQT